ncbi:MAG: HNH endonuclease [Candidatus Marinimicrobia bacterium]|nr:HNH endonuclease [Candidatus Neomarinimicrobiota bacterium]
MTIKEKRKITFNKYGGKCAYCGVDLKKGWHVDELLPIRRKMKWNKKKLIHDGTCLHPERLHIDNQMPSCPSCNISKHSNTLEEFRALISGFMNYLNETNTQYKIAKRYGLVSEINKPVKFYFEKKN